MSNFNLNQLANAVLSSDMYQGKHSTSRVQHILAIAFYKLGLLALTSSSDVSIQLDNGYRVVCKVVENQVLEPALKAEPGKEIVLVKTPCDLCNPTGVFAYTDERCPECSGKGYIESGAA